MMINGQRRQMLLETGFSETELNEAELPEVREPVLRVLNLGAGVQSSTLYLMALRGLITPAPQFAIFADTKWEPSHVYQWLDYLDEVGGVDIPIQRVNEGDIRAEMLGAVDKGTRIANAPFFIRGADGRPTMLRRTCTKEYKILAIERRTGQLLHEMLGKRSYPANAVEGWIGISTDEAMRVKHSRKRYIRHRWPLIEMGMNRTACAAWLRANGFEVPQKSGCIGCPFRSDQLWQDMKENSPVEFADAVDFDKHIRTGIRGVGGKNWVAGIEAFLHKSLMPLDEVDFLRWRSQLKEREGQANMFGDGFLNDCTGLCGV